jgi:nitroreductase
MSLFMDLVYARSSVRDFTDCPVPRELIDRCIEAARHSPSACNRQAWRFIVTEGALKNRIVHECLGDLPVPNRWAVAAPVIVVLATAKDIVTHRLGAYVRGTRYDLLDAGIAGEHFVLQAAELGIGTCWIGWFRKRRLRGILRIPRSWDIPAMIAVGYPLGRREARERRSIDEIREFRS